MAKKIFKKTEVLDLRPAEWPVSTGKFFRLGEAPYIAILVSRAKDAGYTKQELASSWGLMLSDKVNFVRPTSDELSLAEALVVLFEPLSYYLTKRHYSAFLEAME